MRNMNVICVAMTTWEGDYMKAVVQLMTALGQQTKVLFVDYQFTWKDVLMGWVGRSKLPVARMLGWEPRLREITEGESTVHVLTPMPILPINWIKNHWLHRIFNELNAEIIAYSIKKARKQLGMVNAEMINAYNPVIGLPLQKKVGVEATYYYCYDEISQSEWCKTHGPRFEEEFAEKVDGVVVSSEPLMEKFKGANKNVQWIPNGVDFPLFHQAFSPQGNVDQPRVCYIGSLDFRVDFDMLQSAITSLPAVQFDLVGRVIETQKVRELQAFPNVHVHGPQSGADLPAFLQQATVGIIPFVKNEFTRNIYPLKINEYLAAGLPVVMTDFAQLSGFDGLAEVVNGEAAFEGALAKALTENDSALRFERAERAHDNSWEKRAHTLFQLLSQPA